MAAGQTVGWRVDPLRVEVLLTVRMGVVQQLSWRQKRSYWQTLGGAR